jgi:hypothetical protein
MSNPLISFNENLNAFYSQTLIIGKLNLIKNTYGASFSYQVTNPNITLGMAIQIGSLPVSNSPTICINMINQVGIGTTNPQAKLHVNGSLNVNGIIINDPQYIYGVGYWYYNGNFTSYYSTAASPINSYINYRYAASVQFWSGGGQTVSFVTFSSFSSTPCTYLIAGSTNTAGAGHGAAIITIFPGSPPSANITQLQALGMSYIDNSRITLGFGYTTTSTTLSITTYNTGWWGQWQYYYFTMQLLSGRS